MVDAATRIGVGVALAWAALPWLASLARRSRFAPPAEYYRRLVAALGIATVLILMPLVRGWSGLALESHVVAAPNAVTFVDRLVVPLMGTVSRAWPLASLQHVFTAIGGMWLLLAAAGVAASFAGYLRLRRDYGQAEVAPARVWMHAERIAAELGVRAPALHMVDGSFAAFTYGVFSPVIVISSEACEMPDEDLGFVLRHELCHVAQHDTRAMCLIDLAQRCFAGHPSLPALDTEIRVAREARADEAAAAGHALEYARFLLTIAGRIQALQAPSGSLVSMADTALERRVDMLINPSGARARRSTAWLALSAVTLWSLVWLTPASSQPPAYGLPVAQSEVRTERVIQSLSKDVIRATVNRYIPMLRTCFEQNKALDSARLSLSFTIDLDGRTIGGESFDNSDAATSSQAFGELAQCIDNVVRTMRFPAPEDGVVVVSYPLTFERECDEL